MPDSHRLPPDVIEHPDLRLLRAEMEAAKRGPRQMREYRPPASDFEAVVRRAEAAVLPDPDPTGEDTHGGGRFLIVAIVIGLVLMIGSIASLIFLG